LWRKIISGRVALGGIAAFAISAYSAASMHTANPTLASLREDFLLKPEIVPLNNGSFGAMPRPVFDTYQRWQLELETHPDLYFRRQFELLRVPRQALAAYLHTDPANIGLLTNATMGVNVVTHSLRSVLKPGDEILTTNHEYNACNNAWAFVCQKTGAVYINHPIPVPVTTPEAFVEALWAGVTPRTKVIYLSHITSPTALTFPIEAICARARAEGILTVIDGAHVPGQRPLDLDALGADFYTGNCHKWMCSPKGTAFLYARPEVRGMIEPLIVGHHFQSDRTTGDPMLDYIEFFGTRDYACFLTIPAAIDYLNTHDWPARRAQCHALVRDARRRIASLAGTEATQICPDHDDTWFAQLAAVRVSDAWDLKSLWSYLNSTHKIEIPIFAWNGIPIVRVSAQVYTSAQDIDTLVQGVSEWLRQ
jgi:isopenicillin-N epimerase